MCGICGIVRFGSEPSWNLYEAVRAMNQALVHRGPGDEGIWSDDTGRAVLGHRRLSVIDPTDHGHEPMVSREGRFVSAYKAETYNYR